jgi:general L-amino acid transport system permease protein
VWLFRNVPLIVQVFFWYNVTRQLPPVREAIPILGCCFASNRGISVPQLSVTADASLPIAMLVGAAAAWAGALLWNRQRRTRALPPLSRMSMASWGLLGAAVGAAATARIGFTLPRLQGFNFVDGTQLSPEFMALTVAIVAYNIAFIAEILNSGIRAVPRRQIEAARVIGLSPARIFWRITLPQAVRIAVPPLVNQYISLTKSSSLAIAIGYSDLFSIGVIAINHTGQSINVIAVLMLVYLCVSLSISALGNAYNRSLTTRGRR